MPRSDWDAVVTVDATPETVLAQLDELPTLSAVAVRLLQVTADANAGAREVAEVLRGDQSLTALVLSVANSAAYAPREPISTIDRAVAHLGFRTVRRIAFCAKVFECFGPDARGPRQVFDRIGFWKHALAVACGAARLAEATPQLRIGADEAFVAGLLHDIGKVAMSAVFPKAYDRVTAQTEQERGDVADNERLILGVDHTLVGRRLAERWRLPRGLREVIWLHHLSVDGLSGSVSAGPLIALVQAADILAREQRIGHSGNHLFFETSAEAARRLGIDAAQVTAVASRLVDDVARQAELLNLDHETPQQMYFDALSRANSELGRVNDELRENNRRLTAAARYFRALAECDAQLDAQAELGAVVRALARAGLTAFMRPRVGVFAVREGDGAVLLCWREYEGGVFDRSLPAGADFGEWAADIEGDPGLVLVRGPVFLQREFAPLLAENGDLQLWVAGVTHERRLLGGFVFASPADERRRLAGEASELTAFLRSAALAIGRSNAHAAARRLTDDLADNNRRLVNMQVELLRNRTLAMMAEMASGAAHELNSPLAVISGRAQMLSDQTEDPEVQRALRVIEEKAHECSRIVSELMDFARPRPPQLERLPATALLETAREAWAAEPNAPAGALILEGAAELPDIQADRRHLLQLFHELLRNAAQALSGKPDPRVVVSVRRTGAGDAIELVLRDNGAGMSSNVLQRAFDPFYSHRPAGRGRGLGLPRAHRIVEAHGGRIWLQSRVGEGTAVHVVFPQAGRAG